MTCKLPARAESGFSMIEMLIALVVLSLGLLALAAMQITALRHNTGAYFRSQAVILAQDLLDRIYANPQAANAGGYVLNPGRAPEDPGFDCNTGRCDQAQMAKVDLHQWYAVGSERLPGFRAGVTCTPAPCSAASLLTVAVMWDEPDQFGGTGTDCSSNFNVDLYCYRLSFDPPG